MRRNLSALLIVLILFVYLPFNGAKALDIDVPNPAIFVFPAHLTVIGDEAFAGTSVRVVLLKEGLIRIGSKAFDNAERLTDVYIPADTVHIDAGAFGTSSRVVIHGVAGSYAEDWAHKNDLPFVPDYDWRHILFGRPNLHSEKRHTPRSNAETIDTHFIISPFTQQIIEFLSERPHDRPELHPIDYRFP